MIKSDMREVEIRGPKPIVLSELRNGYWKNEKSRYY